MNHFYKIGERDEENEEKNEERVEERVKCVVSFS